MEHVKINVHKDQFAVRIPDIVRLKLVPILKNSMNSVNVFLVTFINVHRIAGQNVAQIFAMKDKSCYQMVNVKIVQITKGY